MHKVTRHVLTPDGATFNSTDSDFLVSDNLDFHPTDVHEDADGSLIVIDTGGWYKLCCPTSQLHKPDVLGAIYRVRRTGAEKVADPRGAKIAWSRMNSEGLAPLLADPRPVVRRLAIREVVRRGGAAIPTLHAILLAGTPEPGQLTQLIRVARESAEMRRNAVWALTRIDRPEARDAVRIGTRDSDETVCQTALHSISLWRDAASVGHLLYMLQAGSFHNRRVAAEALGRIGDRSAAPFLVTAGSLAPQQPDRLLEHSLIFALIEIGDPQAIRFALKQVRPGIRRTALIAIYQMPDGGLEPQMVAGLLGSNEPVFKETAAWIIGRHPASGDALA